MNQVPTLLRKVFRFKDLPQSSLAVFIGGLILSTHFASAADFLIDGATKLSTITVPNSGSHHIRFAGAGYQFPGSLTLSNNGSDSLIFERNAPSDSVLKVNTTLFHFQGQKGTVVFRGLILKLNTGGAVFDTNQSGNRHLVFEGCQILGDTVSTGKTLSWGGDGTSNVTFTNNTLSFTGALSLSGASTITLSNNLFNFSGVVSANATTRLDMKYNTVNKTQFTLDGNFSATCNIQNNYFANPPVKNNLAQGGSQKFISFFKGGSFLSAGSSVINNSRYSSWDGFDFYPPGGAMFSDASNTSIPASKDSTVVWDWKIPGDTLHGAWNGPSPLPNFNFFPSDSTLSFSLPVGKAVFNLNRSNFPRVVSAAFGTAAYSTALPDSVRSWFRSDTTLVVTGSVIVQSITLPARPEGKPILFAKSDIVIVKGSAGLEGSTTFVNGSNMAKEFIPAFDGQNTFRGSKISVSGLGIDTALIFSTVTRAGRTAIQATTLTPLNKRWRSLQKAGKAFGFQAGTNAAGTDSVAFGFSKTGVDAAFKTDSLSWWLGGSAFSAVKDSAGKLWGKTPFASTFQALLIEKLGIGAGRDTLVLESGDTLFSETADKGFQIASTASTPATGLYPYLANFSKGYTFTWQGRNANANEVVKLKIKRTTSGQRGFVVSGANLDTIATTADNDGLVFTLPEDAAGKTFFLGQRFSIGANVSKDTAFGQDSIKGLLSSTPGEIATDTTGLTSNGLPLASSRFLGGRKVILDRLAIQGTFTFSFLARASFIPDSVHAYILSGSGWTDFKPVRQGNRFYFSLGAGQTEVAVLEGLPVFTPSKPPAISFSTSNLSVTPMLTAPEKDRVSTYSVELFSIGMDGVLSRDTSKALSVDSTARLNLALDKMYAYRIKYQILSGTENPDSTWITLDSRKLSAKSIQSLPEQKAKLAWHLIGLPFNGSFNKHLKSGIQGLKDSTEYLLLDWTGTKRDTIAGKAGMNPDLQRGKGYFFAATEPYKAKVDSTDTLDLKSFTSVHNAEGWNVITDPFPFAYPLDQIKITGSPISSAMELVDTTLGNGMISYSWVKRDTLKAFKGYSLYVFGPSQLTFDPFPFKKSLPAKKIGGQNGMMQVSAYNRDGFNRAYLIPGSKESSVPYMPVPASTLFLKLGGNLFQAVPALEEVDQEITLTAERAGQVVFTAGMFQGSGAFVYRLYNPRSGEFVDLAKNPEVGVDKGENVFRLIAGNANFVSTKTAALLQTLPRTFSLDQNAPNPWVGTTRIRYTLPTGNGRIIRGKLEIEDVQGRTLFAAALEDLSVGSHSILIAKKDWIAGAYIYRMTVITDRRTLRLQKRMIVTQ